ncbi:MAG: hypothetical protein WBA93_07930 [Microcoleaceae cyanobacterium]
MKNKLTQTNVARILGVSFQRVHTLRIRNRITFSWDVDLKSWVTSEDNLQKYLNERGKRPSRVGCELTYL